MPFSQRWSRYSARHRISLWYIRWTRPRSRRKRALDPDPFDDLASLESARLILRPMGMDDAAAVFAYASDPAVAEYVTWYPHTSINDSRTFLRGVEERRARGDVSSWGVVLRSDGRLIGTCGYQSWWRTDHCAEIGYALARAYWGRGLMTEAVRAACRFGFEQMRLHRVQARCVAQNIPSARVMEKAGMRYEGTLRESVLHKGQYVDLKMYAVLAGEFTGT